MIITSLNQYPAVLIALQKLPAPERIAKLRNLCRTDLYFLLRYGCARKDLEHPWSFARCREVQASPDGHLDLWAREHGKSSIITFGLTILDILASHGDEPLREEEATIGIFSHTRPIAKGFLRQIKRELEANDRLKEWFPDVLWSNPHKEAQKWGEDDGIVVKRKGNPKESTVEAHGLVDGQPTSKHFRMRVYDDVVVSGSVTTPEMIQKTTEAWELSDNLGTDGGGFRVAGTRYHFNDTYGEMVRRKVVSPRIYPCTVDGTENFEPDNCVLMSPEMLADKRRTQGMHTFATQMLLNPKGDSSQGFKREWLCYSSSPPQRHGLNVYIIVDPANTKKKSSDWTCMWALGLGRDRKYVALDIVRDKLNLKERAEALFELHEKWLPLGVGYEQYGLQADIQFIEHLQTERNYRFKITPLGGQTSKPDRIKRLIPIFEEGRVYLPRQKHRTLYDGATVNLIDVFVEEEYAAFPVSVHDDMLDCLARILDENMKVKWPIGIGAMTAWERPEPKRASRDWNERQRERTSPSGWERPEPTRGARRW